MDDLLAARLQMAISLGFHILFAVAGMAMPLFMVVAEWRYIRTKEPHYLDLAHRWAKGTAILFAVGAVSGTVLSFELGLLWPRFMERAGPLIGMPFSLEGFAFFLEAIFLGVYLYGWDRVPERVHLASGLAVAGSGLMSGVFVVSVNGWMNTPAGFELKGSEIIALDLWSAFFNPAFPSQAVHMALAAYCSVAFAMLAIHAARLRRDPSSALHLAAARMAFAAALVTTPLQIASGDLAAKQIAARQPIKLAAAEAHFETQAHAPLTIGGLPDVETRTVHGALHIPGGLSFLAKGHFDAEVTGLDRAPKELWPPVAIVHIAFQVMVGAGFAMLGFLAWGAFLWRRRRAFPTSRSFLGVAIACGPLGLVAIEAGWVVTEVGRQPWIIQGLLKTADAVTPMPGLWVPCIGFTLLYAVLGVTVVLLLKAQVLASSTQRVPEPARKPEATS